MKIFKYETMDELARRSPEMSLEEIDAELRRRALAKTMAVVILAILLAAPLIYILDKFI